MRSSIREACSYSCGVLMLVYAIQGNLLATITAPVPEIDSSSISAGLGLLAAGILILRSRRRSK